MTTAAPQRLESWGSLDRPPMPESLASTGLGPEFIIDLLLKTLYVQGVRTGQQLVESIRLPFTF
ncbi:MAG TPA: hypothetical protein VFM14_17675, partial [Gemmatimonadales bacterium]|nr:hypothetical protein [Gemmatimonadales bacterium]